MAAPTVPPTLSVSNLSVSYGAHSALKGLSIDINAGELAGVIGPNGAGKTTFIKALCGRVDSTGTITIKGKPIKKGQDRRQTIGLVPQDIGLYPHLTAQENLDVMARLLGVSKQQRRSGIARALNAVGMADKAKVLVQDMSGGMKRRINVAAAIMHNPDVIIFDEPTAGVDIPARDTVHHLARDLAASGKAVILITHELEQAEILCDKILLLVEGQKRAFTSPMKLLSEAFDDENHVTLRLASPPSDILMSSLKPFGLIQSDQSTQWHGVTTSDISFFSNQVSSAIEGHDNEVRALNLQRPGLTALMHDIISEQRERP